MTDDVVADFMTDVIPDTGAYDEPVRGRVLMNREQVVIVTADDRTAFAIDDVFDLAYGSAPTEMRRFFEDTVTIAYEKLGQKRVALVEGADDVVERFTNLLFKGILNETPVTIKHPAKVGGRVTDASFRRASMYVSPTAVRFSADDPLTIDVSTVSHFERVNRAVGDTQRSMLSIRHAPEREVVTTEIGLSSQNKLNVLGRFLRTEYTQLREELEDVSLSDEEVEALVGLYSGATVGSLAGMLGVDASRASYLLDTLVEKGLLEETASGMELTPIGTLAVGQHLEDVNL